MSEDRGDNVEEVVEEEVVSEEGLAATALIDEAVEEKGEAPSRDETTGKFQKKVHENQIPKSRFDDAVGKERAAREAAERRATEAESRLRRDERSDEVAKMETAIEALEVKHSKMLLDGESEQASKIMGEIRRAERDIARAESDARHSQSTAAAVEQVRMEATIAKLESSYPTFNLDSDQYDQDIVDIVLAEQDRLIRVERLSPSKAMEKAASKLMSKLHPGVAVDEGVPKGLAANKGTGNRKSDQVTRNIAAAGRQPSSMNASGKDSDKAGASLPSTPVTMEEFNALPESAKFKMRGDVL